MSTPLSATVPGLDYTGIFDRLERSLNEHLPRVAGERAQAPQLLAELLALPLRERRRAALGERRFHLYTLAAHALERAKEETRSDLATAFGLARLARLIASRVSARLCGRAALEELRERALAAEANLLLACGGLPVHAESLPVLDSV
ncbi:MAG TPA: hypothetical protein VFE33_07090 [Thermoanaerobaculia bacterium]|nr:hypothetical protein [Thermoanaerobaculia bacterium]